jgi:hypothetical protein
MMERKPCTEVTSPKSRMSANSIMPADIQVAAKQAAEKRLRPSVFG